jgi:hypothetical protein
MSRCASYRDSDGTRCSGSFGPACPHPRASGCATRRGTRHSGSWHAATARLPTRMDRPGTVPTPSSEARHGGSSVRAHTPRRGRPSCRNTFGCVRSCRPCDDACNSRISCPSRLPTLAPPVRLGSGAGPPARAGLLSNRAAARGQRPSDLSRSSEFQHYPRAPTCCNPPQRAGP